MPGLARGARRFTVAGEQGPRGPEISGHAGPPLAAASLSAVSVTCGQLQSDVRNKNSRNKQFASVKLCAALSGGRKSCAVLLSGRDVSRPFVQRVHAVDDTCP